MKVMTQRMGWPPLGVLAPRLVLLVVLGACRPSSEEIGGYGTPDAALSGMGSCNLSLPETVSDEEAIVAVLKAEGTYVVQQDIASLVTLWADDGRIIDTAHTPADPSDDQTWQGKDAIRHRYVHRVFPGAPRVAGPSDMVVNITGEKAVVTGTTRIGDELSPAGDRWQLVKVGDCWVIQELVFNLELQ
jgi:hypothetical protein